MMIILRSKTGDGGGRWEIIQKWKDDTEFGFNIGDPFEWRRFLLRSSLQIVDEDGTPMVYMVSKFGGSDKSVYLFPGFDKKGNKLPTMLYGRLDKDHKGYWGDKR